MASRFSSPAEWVAARRSVLSRGGLWLDGREPGRPDPAGFASARLRILICRLSPYDDVAPSITHRMLLSVAQAVPGVYADLAFFPPEKDAALMRKDGMPLWLATGAKCAPAEFDIVAVSLSVQQEALNLPTALHYSGLKLDYAGRMADDQHPLIILGGHGAGSVPFLHGDAAGPGSGGLVDAVCLGDGITWLREFLKRCLDRRRPDNRKIGFLRALARDLPGTYVPACYRHEYDGDRLAAIRPAGPDLPVPVHFRQDPLHDWLRDYDGAFIPLTPEETEETLPLAAGCAYRCRFCQTGWTRKELSAADQPDLLAAAMKLKSRLVNSDLNLLASDACSIAGLEPVMDALCPLFRNVSVKSLSVSSLVRRPEYFQLLRKLAKHEFTFGVEGVSARLRAWLGKPATAPDLLRIVASLAEGGLRQLKLFFIATGLEAEPDLAELEGLLKGIRAKAPACRLIASFMPLFHAPFTPLQFAPLRAWSPELERSLMSAVRSAGGEFRWSAAPGEIALMNRLCRSGRAATPALVDFALRRGLVYYSHLPAARVRDFAAVLPAHADELEQSSVLPWSDLQATVDPAALWRSYAKAVAEWNTPPASALPAPTSWRRDAGPVAVPGPATERRNFWIQILPEQAGLPDHVIVRDALHGLFRKWKIGVSAYWGRPELLRPPAAGGWALASADFKTGTALPAGVPAENPAGISPDDWLFEIHRADGRAGAAVPDSLRRARAKFQTLRQGSSRWHVVERAYRSRTGVAAVKEDAGQVWLYALLGSKMPAGLVDFSGATATAVFARHAAPCPACGGTRYHVRVSASAAPADLCVDCLGRRP